MSGEPNNNTPNPESAMVASVVDTPAPAAPPAGVSDAAVTAAPAGGEIPPAGQPSAPAPPQIEPSALNEAMAEVAAEEAARIAASKQPPPTDKPALDPAKKEDGAPAAVEPAPAQVAYEYNLPDTIVVSNEQKGELHKAFDAFRADPAKGAQGLIDLHAKAIKEFADASVRNQYDVFNGTRREWRDAMKSDEEIGGSGYKTTQKSVLRMFDKFVGKEYRETFNSMLMVTGVGDHPEFNRMMARVARFFDEPPPPPPNAMKAPKDAGRNPALSREERLYGSPGR